MTDDPSLTAAYALKGRDEMRRLYEAWADSYDAAFVEAQGYLMPAKVADTFVASGGAGPVLDVGAGTGSVAQHLAGHGITNIDGIDLSEDMLRVAGKKRIYRDLICGDITRPLGKIGPYNSIVSAGTFTFGHVGPEGLTALFEVAAPGCLFVLGINAEHYEDAGFAAALDAVQSQISDVHLRDERIYSDRADVAHRKDLARLLTFRLA